MRFLVSAPIIMKKYENLTNLDTEHEALTVLMEECGEVIQECSKIIRFGADYTRLNKELGDLFALIQILDSFGVLNEVEITAQIAAKREKLKFFSNLL